MVLALPAVALLGAGVALRSATEPPPATRNASALANDVRSVAVVDRTPQPVRGYSAPTPRPQLPDPEPALEPVEARMVNDVPMVNEDVWNGPAPVNVDWVDIEPSPDEVTTEVLTIDRPADMTIELE